MKRRDLLKFAVGAAFPPARPRRVSAQGDYPRRPARIIAGFAAGGGVDITARLGVIGSTNGSDSPSSTTTGPASTAIATEAVVKAPADGYTQLLATLPIAVNATLYPN